MEHVEGRSRPARSDAGAIPLAAAMTSALQEARTASRRRILGIAGAPGSGKSTVAARLLAEATDSGIDAVVVPMDGFHLAHRVLEASGLVGVKGAPHTFDAHGFVALLRRVRAQRPGDATIWAPEFRREIEEPVAGAVEVRADHRLVIVEGNYLLLDDDPWNFVAPLLDSAWMLTPDEAARRARLIARHEHHGRDAHSAREHALGSDEANARAVMFSSSAGAQVIDVDPG